jgi:flagellar biosynthetic protein FliR
MAVTFAFANILVYLLVWVRLAGMILLNPLLSRNGVPAMVRAGLALFLALLLAPQQPAATFEAVYAMSTAGYLFAAVRELALGVVFGYVFQVFYYMLFYVGDVIDTDIGLSMAKTMDPATNISTGFSTSLLTALFALYLFVSGSQYTLLHIFADTFESINVGSFTLNTGLLAFLLRMFGRVFVLALRLAAPLIVAEFILQFSMGVLMKFIPQITIFVVNFQLRIILGLLMLYVFAPYIGAFIDNYIGALFDNLVDAAAMMAQTQG